MNTMTRLCVVLLCLFTTSMAGAQTREANRLAREGAEAYAQGNTDTATELFQKAAEISPDSARIQYSLGTAKAKQKDNVAAAEALGRSLNYDDLPTPENAWFNLGLTQVELANAIDPQMQDATKAKIGKLQEALHSFRKSVIENPGDREAKFNYETTLKMIRDLQQQQEEQQSEENQEEGEKKEEEDQEKQEGEEENKEEQEGEQNQDQQGEQEQQKSEGENQEQQEQEPQEQQNQEGEQEEQEGEEGEGEEQEEGMDPADATPTPTPEAQPETQSGEPGQPEEVEFTPEQLDALRVLNALEETKPEQFKQVFQMKSRSGAKDKKW